jgi:hypothetical protein
MVKKNKGKKKESLLIKSAKEASSSLSSVKQGYAGEIQIPRSKLQENVIVANLMFQTNLVSTAAGINQMVFTSDITSGPVIDLASFQATWESYRVLGFKIEFFPSNRYSKVTTLCTPGVGVVDHESVGALSSLGAGFSHGSCRILSVEDPWTDRADFQGNKQPPMVAKMMGSDEAQFGATTAAPPVEYAIKFYFTALSPSITYGLWLATFLVQFMGRT